MAEVKHKEGRHVGLDFYDLLIEAHYRRDHRGTEQSSRSKNPTKGRRVSDWFHAVGKDDSQRSEIKCFRNGEVWEDTFPPPRPGWQLPLVPLAGSSDPQFGGQGVALVGHEHDISARREAERHLAQMESRYRGLLEGRSQADAYFPVVRLLAATHHTPGKMVLSEP